MRDYPTLHLDTHELYICSTFNCILRSVVFNKLPRPTVEQMIPMTSHMLMSSDIRK
jgi:hypothetical protein